MTDQPTFEYRDDDGDDLTVRPMRGIPAVLILTGTNGIAVDLDRVEEVVAGIRDAARTATAIDTASDTAQHPAVRQTGQQPDETVAYGDGKGRVYCRNCASTTAADLPLVIDHVDHWETCGSCGRYVVDVARQQPTPAAGLDASQPATDQLTVVSLAHMLSAADVEINHGNYPTYDTLAESGQQQYRQAARYLLARCNITARTVEGTDQ